MKSRLSLAILVLAASLAGTSSATELDAGAQARLGLRLATLAAGDAHPATRAIAEVLDPAALAKAAGELEAAQAAAGAARAEAERTRTLFAAQGNASRKSMEAAQAQAVAGRARLRQAQVAVRGTWGDGIAGMDALRRNRLIDALVAGTQVLLKAEPLDPAAPARVRAATLQMPHGTSLPARVLGRLPRSGSGLAAGWLLQADAGPLVPGMVLTAQLDGEQNPLRGVLLPRAAIVRWNGLDWAYVATGATHFERRVVRARAMTPAGWLVGAPFKPGERVVVQGAEALIEVDAAPLHGSAADAADDD